jgi:hypothetical protein
MSFRETFYEVILLVDDRAPPAVIRYSIDFVVSRRSTALPLGSSFAERAFLKNFLRKIGLYLAKDVDVVKEDAGCARRAPVHARNSAPLDNLRIRIRKGARLLLGPSVLNRR